MCKKLLYSMIRQVFFSSTTQGKEWAESETARHSTKSDNQDEQKEKAAGKFRKARKYESGGAKKKKKWQV